MSTTTPNLGLFKYDVITDGPANFNINRSLNYNWDILDNAIAQGDFFPEQAGNEGKFLSTNGTNTFWKEVSGGGGGGGVLPDQTDKAGCLLSTNGTDAFWGNTVELSHVVIEHFFDEFKATGYNIYSDGWLEEWGQLTSTTTSFINEFDSTNYAVFITSDSSSTAKVSNKSTESFKTSVSSGSWLAIGEIKKGKNESTI